MIRINMLPVKQVQRRDSYMFWKILCVLFLAAAATLCWFLSEAELDKVELNQTVKEWKSTFGKYSGKGIVLKSRHERLKRECKTRSGSGTVTPDARPTPAPDAGAPAEEPPADEPSPDTDPALEDDPDAGPPKGNEPPPDEIW